VLIDRYKDRLAGVYAASGRFPLWREGLFEARRRYWTSSVGLIVSRPRVRLTTRYPALHLYIYTALRQSLPTDPDLQVRYAQYFFLVIYLVTFLLVSTIYYLASRRSARGYPQALLVPLVLSKRLHSIYLLRLFNDPIAMVLFYASVVFYMLGGLWGALGSIFYG
jgi:hypothetical protein